MRECVPAKEAELAQQHQLYEPMLYYGSNPKIAIDYISDIHLLHHAKYFDGDIQKCIKVIAKSLYKSQNELVQTSRNTGIQLFLGDISTDVNVTINFYKQYRLHFIYQQYKKFRKQIWDKNRILSFKKEQIQYKKRYDILLRYIEKVKVDIETSKSSISQYINYGKVIAPKGSLAQIENYLNSNYYKKRDLPNFVTNKILEIANLYEKLSLLNKTLFRLEGMLDTTCPDIPMCLSDFKYTHSLIGVIILGNHEYVGFSNVETALKFYKEKLEPLGYHILQNQVLELSNAIIYGGSGFAKYNTQFNANNLKNCDAMMGNRSYEIEQTTLFEKKYVKAKEYALKTGKCFICATHYPVKDCLDKFDREAIYFSGHTHQNERIRSSDKVVYADNQIGYHNKGTVCHDGRRPRAYQYWHSGRRAERAVIPVGSCRNQEQRNPQADGQTPGLPQGIQKWGTESKAEQGKTFWYHAKGRRAHAETAPVRGRWIHYLPCNTLYRSKILQPETFKGLGDTNGRTADPDTHQPGA